MLTRLTSNVVLTWAAFGCAHPKRNAARNDVIDAVLNHHPANARIVVNDLRGGDYPDLVQYLQSEYLTFTARPPFDAQAPF